jgi:hypothetical protein
LACGRLRLRGMCHRCLVRFGKGSWIIAVCAVAVAAVGGGLDAIETAREVNQKVLLVVDYAETRTKLDAMLAKIAGPPDGPEMRVLLLARSAGEWWRQLISCCDKPTRAPLNAAEPMTIGPVSETSRQSEVFREALVAFAGRLLDTCPDAEDPLDDPGAPVLVVHVAALLVVLNLVSAGAATEAPRTAGEALAELLEHEAKYWHQSQAALRLGLDTELQRRAVAAGCLVGADDEAAADMLLAAIPGLGDSSLKRGEVARWLHDLYPVPQSAEAEEEWIGPLQPDRVAEELVVSVLRERPDLIPLLFGRLKGRRAARALTVLARHAMADPAADPVALGQIDVALRSDLERLAVPAVTVAVGTNPDVGRLIKNALISEAMPVDVLELMAEALPYPSRALAETAVVVYQQLTEGSAGSTEKDARYLNELSNRLSRLGRREESLTAIERAVSLYRLYRVLAETGSALDPSLIASVLDELADLLTSLKGEPEADGGTRDRSG